jgi:hypothetical protein
VLVLVGPSVVTGRGYASTSRGGVVVSVRSRWMGSACMDVGVAISDGVEEVMVRSKESASGGSGVGGRGGMVLVAAAEDTDRDTRCQQDPGPSPPRRVATGGGICGRCDVGRSDVSSQAETVVNNVLLFTF